LHAGLHVIRKPACMDFACRPACTLHTNMHMHFACWPAWILHANLQLLYIPTCICFTFRPTTVLHAELRVNFACLPACTLHEVLALCWSAYMTFAFLLAPILQTSPKVLCMLSCLHFVSVNTDVFVRYVLVCQTAVILHTFSLGTPCFLQANCTHIVVGLHLLSAPSC
jgi:hypothetical protein